MTRLADYPDEIDALAVAEFDQHYPALQLAELVVVIAAYNEADGIGAVLTEMPKRCCGMPVDVLVVVDGATDATAEVARAYGAYTCVAPRNRGQGAALRLGYRLAARHGARFVVTTDADGQYDGAELETLVTPLLDGRADFVTGSRRLGHHVSDNRVRWLGVRVFAVLASVLTWRHITDTSFGFRAMRAELARSVTLTEPQYQSSELLLGVAARGARVVEVPMTMRLRAHGASKKGANLVYGANYARVMVRTWFREYVRGGRRR
ncbi:MULTISPECIES: glycosyltransferase family 2 protein [Mycolicibacterium]|jgi:glycosyltransferase involved in cell wall biosynthesis|nr:MULTISPECIES: glycosyltransferase family 2 protein [Mycolicibacterium]MCG7580965.1 glycosyltransferase family 2 protein [Mycolicibacterium sp. OfavD-34-C]